MSRLPLGLLSDTATVQADGSLAIGGCDVGEMAAQYGTPLFIYDEEQLRARCREAVTTFGLGNAVYATKAFLCTAMARLAYDEGMLLDVASGGELFVALRAGVPADSIVMHGNNKSIAELRMRSLRACATLSSTASTNSIASMRCTPRVYRCRT